ncbi:MAG: type I restriction endonuclease subunit R [Acidimicrobiia bacterium]|nr:type I restriction endonuclease subunit R [Acidimicrobiia bacterium]MYE62778.1 type I restriction endonuclease subunit R [Rhodothermaceae bacterium]MYJ20537.1 type I restriction endonuclease subunit R [Rhodothermaceae bacterium]
MKLSSYTEDILVQQTTAEYLERCLSWESVYAHNTETFGLDGTLGRASDEDVVLVRYLRQALEKLNPGLPTEAYENAIRAIVQVSASHSTLQTNREKYDLLRNGVKVTYRDPRGGMETRTLRVFDFGNAENNHFLAVRELWIRGPLYRRRADIVGFVNGVPLLFMELKNIHRNIRRAYDENLSDYKDTIAHVFHHNAFVVLGNGIDARIGSYSASFEFLRAWKRLDEDEPGVVDMETLLKGVCTKANFLDLFENFILFDDSGEKLVKVVAQNQQYLGVNRAIHSMEMGHNLNGKLGVFWHTQGAGKSYSMVFFSRKVHRKLGGNFTFLVLTDRDDLDNQIYRTYAGCNIVGEHEEARAESGNHLRRLLGKHKAYVFSLIQKFNKDVSPNQPYSNRSDIIVIVDEAHRTQYGRLALNWRNALPKALYIAFTGTPLMKEDELTRRVFGDYVSRYGFQRAVEDGATVPLYYDARGENLDVATDELNQKIADKLEEFESGDIDTEQRLEHELRREYHILTAPKRLDAIAKDFVTHYSIAWESGKAMFVVIDKITAVRMHKLITKYWKERISQLEADLSGASQDQERLTLERQVAWMKETKIAVVVSEAQGEVAKFRKWDLDIQLHRKLIKEGFETDDGQRIDLESAFKKDGHPFRIAIVCAMWLTGFDVKSLATLYLDKPLKAHTLMQAIARANRVHKGKYHGLIVDYCGILKNLRSALATFAGHTGREECSVSKVPAKPHWELLEELVEAIDAVRVFLDTKKFQLKDIIDKTGFDRNAAIVVGKEIVNESDETRKRFEIMARTVSRRFKACLNVAGVNDHRRDHDAINIIYRSLQEDRDQADISNIIKELHTIVGESISLTAADGERNVRAPYDISAIDFERLQQEFARSPKKNTQVQNLKDAIEKRLTLMIAQNPSRTDFQQHYEKLVAEYNREKDSVTIEQTFEELLKFVADLDAEQERAVREGLDEPTLALFDLLKKDNLTPSDIKCIKKVATDLHARLQSELTRISDWQKKEATRDYMKQKIYDFLYSDETGLPPSYSKTEVTTKSDMVFTHILYQQQHGMALAA